MVGRSLLAEASFRRFFLFFAAGLIVALALGSTALPQTPDCERFDGIHPTLELVPFRNPRLSEGDTPDQQWRVDRTAEDNDPVASFLETLPRNDAAFEVVVGQGRLMTLKEDIIGREGTAVIAVGDPSIIGFEVLPNPRMIRVTGKRAGVTDLSVTTGDDKTYSFEVHAVYDLTLLRAQLAQVFPDAYLRFGQIREHLVVEGQARSPAQVTQILQTIQAYLDSVAVTYSGGGGGRTPRGKTAREERSQSDETDGSTGNGDDQDSEGRRPEAYVESGGDGGGGIIHASPEVINLIRVPGSQQVLLEVKIAELNRTALREIGADILGVDPDTGNIVGTQMAGGLVSAAGAAGLGGLIGRAAGSLGTDTTAFGIFPSGDFQVLLRALRQNRIASILSEPNLTTMSGHRASFLAGGEFPVPVPQVSGGITNSITIEWKKFGAQLDFLPYVMADDRIRLTVTPEVSTIDFQLGTTLVLGGDPVPGLNTRRATTTVELREGQTLAMAGLLQVEIAAGTSRIPGLGDLPYIGPLFSNTSHRRVEKELLVLVTPHLVQPMEADQVPCLPTDGINDPNDLELYLLNRIEGRTGRAFRPTTRWDNPLYLVELMHLEQRCISGPVGFSE